MLALQRRRARFAALVGIGFALALIACGSDTNRECIVPEPASTPEVAESLARLAGLPFAEFIDNSSAALVRRSPEMLTDLGLSSAYGLRDDQLDDISDEYISQTHSLMAGILKFLRGHDRAALDPEQQITYDVYEWFLDDQGRQGEFRYFDYPVSPIITAEHKQLWLLLSDIHPLATVDNAEDYIARLRQVSRKLAQVRDSLERHRDAGIVAPRFLLQWSLPELHSVAAASPRQLSLYTRLADQLAAMPSVDGDHRRALLDRAETAIDCHVIPAFRDLAATVEELAATAPSAAGVWQFAGGDEYYRQALRHHTTTEMTADEIHQLGLDEVARIHADMRERFAALGYPADQSLTELYTRVATEGGTVPAGQVQAEYEALIAEAGQNLDAAFDLRPSADVIVVGGTSGAFYVSGTPDGARPGQFHVNVNGPRPRYDMPTLAYHEAIPGHHFQISLAQEQELPTFRAHTTFTAHVEGWALYAEGLAAELGWYKDDVYGDLGRLQAEVFRAARLVVDTGIHAKQWTFAQAVDYMVDNVAYPRQNMEFQVTRYIAWPGQATAYKTGMLRILAARQRAIDQLGDRYAAKDFHRAVLTSGSVPLDILDHIVSRYIESAR